MSGIDKAELARRAELVASEWGGICGPHEAFYIHSVAYSAGRSKEAFTRFDVARTLNDTADIQVSSVHEALGHAASLSRFFWPSGMGKKNAAIVKLREARAKKLRESFGLGDQSALRDRALRDAMEHFDERVDEYLLRNDHGYFFPDPMIDSVDLAADPEGRIFKMLDPVKLGFVLLGDVHFFGAIRTEVEMVHAVSVEMRDGGGRLVAASS